MVRTPPAVVRNLIDGSTLGPGYGEFRTDFEPILARIARSQSHNPSGGGARAAIVDHGNPGAWHGTSPTAPATTIACTSDAEVVEGVVGALDSHEFVFARLMGFADALGCTWGFSLLSPWS
jgi:RNA exonuclease 1